MMIDHHNHHPLLLQEMDASSSQTLESMLVMKVSSSSSSSSSSSASAVAATAPVSPSAPASIQQEKKPRPPEEAMRCPRCESSNTKFCYYNNYSLSQPRYFCKSCRRYWTKGGTLRNVPVGGGCRRSHHHPHHHHSRRSFTSSSSSSSSSSSNTSSTACRTPTPLDHLHLHPHDQPLIITAAAAPCSSIPIQSPPPGCYRNRNIPHSLPCHYPTNPNPPQSSSPNCCSDLTLAFARLQRQVVGAAGGFIHELENVSLLGNNTSSSPGVAHLENIQDLEISSTGHDHFRPNLDSIRPLGLRSSLLGDQGLGIGLYGGGNTGIIGGRNIGTRDHGMGDVGTNYHVDVDVDVMNTINTNTNTAAASMPVATASRVKEEADVHGVCEDDQGRFLWGFPWQIINNDEGNVSGAGGGGGPAGTSLSLGSAAAAAGCDHLESARESCWNSNGLAGGSSWQYGLLHSPLI